MLYEINKHFNNNNNVHTNKYLIGHKDLFRGVIVKEWVVSNQNRIHFKSHNKLIVKMCTQHYHDFWKRRFVALHEPEVQSKVLQDEA